MHHFLKPTNQLERSPTFAEVDFWGAWWLFLSTLPVHCSFYVGTILFNYCEICFSNVNQDPYDREGSCLSVKVVRQKYYPTALFIIHFLLQLSQYISEFLFFVESAISSLPLSACHMQTCSTMYAQPQSPKSWPMHLFNNSAVGFSLQRENETAGHWSLIFFSRGWYADWFFRWSGAKLENRHMVFPFSRDKVVVHCS